MARTGFFGVLSRATLASGLTLALSLASVGVAAADPGPFAAGRSRISISGGSAGGFSGSRYLVLGATYGYFVVDGLEVGLGTQVWFLDDPTIFSVTPQARYVLHFVPVLKPYVGGFFSRQFVSGDEFDDWSTIGARAGAFYVTGGGGFVGGGIVYERILDCQFADDSDCSDIYPEIAFSIVF